MSNARQKSGSKASRIKSPNQSRQVAHGPRSNRAAPGDPQVNSDATVGLLVRHGISKLRTEDVARSAGVSRAFVLRHFRTKQQLVLWRSETLLIKALKGASNARCSPEADAGWLVLSMRSSMMRLTFFFGRGSLIGFALGLEPIHRRSPERFWYDTSLHVGSGGHLERNSQEATGSRRILQTTFSI